MHQFTDLKLSHLKTSRRQFIWVSIIFLVVFGYVMWDDPGCLVCYLKIGAVGILIYGVWYWEHTKARTLASTVSGSGDQWNVVYSTGRQLPFSLLEIKYIQTTNNLEGKLDEITVVREKGAAIRLSNDMDNLQTLLELLDPTQQMRGLGDEVSTKQAYWWGGLMLMGQFLGTVFVFYVEGWSFSFYIMLVLCLIELVIIPYILYCLSKTYPKITKTIE